MADSLAFLTDGTPEQVCAYIKTLGNEHHDSEWKHVLVELVGRCSSEPELHLFQFVLSCLPKSRRLLLCTMSIPLVFSARVNSFRTQALADFEAWALATTVSILIHAPEQDLVDDEHTFDQILMEQVLSGVSYKRQTMVQFIEVTLWPLYEHWTAIQPRDFELFNYISNVLGCLLHLSRGFEPLICTGEFSSSIGKSSLIYWHHYQILFLVFMPNRFSEFLSTHGWMLTNTIRNRIHPIIEMFLQVRPVNLSSITAENLGHLVSTIPPKRLLDARVSLGSVLWMLPLPVVTKLLSQIDASILIQIMICSVIEYSPPPRVIRLSLPGGERQYVASMIDKTVAIIDACDTETTNFIGDDYCFLDRLKTQPYNSLFDPLLVRLTRIWCSGAGSDDEEEVSLPLALRELTRPFTLATSLRTMIEERFAWSRFLALDHQAEQEVKCTNELIQVNHARACARSDEEIAEPTPFERVPARLPFLSLQLASNHLKSRRPFIPAAICARILHESLPDHLADLGAKIDPRFAVFISRAHAFDPIRPFPRARSRDVQSDSLEDSDAGASKKRLL